MIASQTTVPARGPAHPPVPPSGPIGEGVAAAASSARSPLDPLRKAAILVVSLEQPLASQLLAQLDRPAVEAVTLEIARLDRVAPEEQRSVLEEFYGLGLRRLRFVFDDLVRMLDTDIQASFHPEDAATWALALVGAARPVRFKVLGALQPAAADDLRQRIGTIGPFRLDDAEVAQAEIADRLRRLHDHG